METHSCILDSQGFEDCIVFEEIMDQFNEDFSEYFLNEQGLKETQRMS